MQPTDAVTTVALLARKQGMSVDLFSRYWRDVHGVLAVRIPGFWSYTQYHVTPVSPTAPGPAEFVMDGFAEVCFACEADREAMGRSAVVPLILRDEPNVFSRTLLYALAPGASLSLITPVGRDTDYYTPEASYVLVARSPGNVSAEAVATALPTELLPGLQDSPGLKALRRHLLASGDPSLWQTTSGVDNTEQDLRNSVVIQARWQTAAQADAALQGVRGARSAVFDDVQVYRVTARCAMVVEGAPTHLGLRGLDVWRTIQEAGADNQNDAAVLRTVYGADLKAPVG